VVHPLQPTNDQYNSPLIETFVANKILLVNTEQKIKQLNKLFLKRQTRVILISALEANQVLAQRAQHLQSTSLDKCSNLDVCLFSQIIFYRTLFT